MTDIDFVNLTIARRFLAPEIPAICLDAELPLPFVSNTFDGLYCLDGLHYVRSKMALLSEVDRVVSDEDGAWLFAHMHNAAAKTSTPARRSTPTAMRSASHSGSSVWCRRRPSSIGSGSDGSLDLTGPPTRRR